MNLLAQNQPRQNLPGRVVGLLQDAPDQSAPYFQHWYEANRAKVLARGKAYRDANKDKINARRRAKAALNRKKINARARRKYNTDKAYREAQKARANARYQRLKEKP